MQTATILHNIDKLLDQLQCSDSQRTLARSLSLCGALASLLECSPRDLLRSLEPAMTALRNTDNAAIRDAVEGRR